MDYRTHNVSDRITAYPSFGRQTASRFSESEMPTSQDLRTLWQCAIVAVVESEGVEGVMPFGVGRLGRSGAIPPVVVVIVPVGRPGTAFVKKDHCLMGRDFKALLTRLARHVIIHSDEVIS